jgi:4-hydroxy-4-methyl-2-oxoglutarate aldolase
MQATVVRNIHRADSAAIETLERLGVATVHEAQWRKPLADKGLKYIDGPVEY